MAHSAKALLEQQKSIIPSHSAKAVAENAKSAYRNGWISENLDRVNLTMPKGKKEQIRIAAERMGLSVNAYINIAVDEKMKNDY